jgi:uncharacterized protein YunC (DUF1805 family)
MAEPARILTAPSSASATSRCHGHVLVSGSYGGEYNAFHAAKWGLRGAVLNDAGVGKNQAGIRGLAYLERVQVPGATADAFSSHIGDGGHMLKAGRISHVNEAARALGCQVGQTVRECAERMCRGNVVEAAMPPVSGGHRHMLREEAPTLVCLDAAPMLTPDDIGSIAVTGSHAALFRGRPDDVIKVAVKAIFFSDAGIGLDEAGVARLPTLDGRAIAAGTASHTSAEIGNSRSIYHDGVLSRVNVTAAALGATVGMRVKEFVEQLLCVWSEVR